GCEPAHGLVWRPTAIPHDLGAFAATRRWRYPSRIGQQQTLSVPYNSQSETRIVRALLATVANASSPELRMTAVGPTSTSESPCRNPPRNFLQRLHRSGRRSPQKCALPG